MLNNANFKHCIKTDLLLDLIANEIITYAYTLKDTKVMLIYKVENANFRPGIHDTKYITVETVDDFINDCNLLDAE